MVRVKICGITNLTDGLAAVESGADLLGFVFYAASPRYIEPERASEIISMLRAHSRTTRFVGVFVNAPVDRVRAVMQMAQLDLAQLHGSESAEFLQKLGACAYKALRPRNADEARAQIAIYEPMGSRENAPSFIVDAFDANQYGGTGRPVDWVIATGIAQTYPILLAGGLNAENVAKAIGVVHPWGVDVSSGVERAPGLKDRDKVQRFVAAVRQKGEA